MSIQPQSWSESDSQTYQQLAAVAVPARLEQLVTLLTLLPFRPDEPFHLVEIGSGEGFLAAAILTAFPRATLTALDGSAAMRATTLERLSQFGSRSQVEPFDLFSEDWHPYLDSAQAVVSSLVLHHLEAAAKRCLFAEIHRRLVEPGVCLMADLVEPQGPEARELFAAGWDRSVQAQAGSRVHLATAFEQEKWNYYRYPDPVDKPSPLFEQLLWLKEAGFTRVDCFWLQAGHAIYGGLKTVAPGADRLRYEAAWRIAEVTLRDAPDKNSQLRQE
ncbi:MAG TPA: class I SAM-dependent methyltransferase [Anaerolineae bacterium]|nr:class I SAM-dependent methyltransferase [Anaerolineae bacterium]